MNEELKPCPFCGSDDVELEYDSFIDYCIIECRECGVERNRCWDEDDAIELWNTRPIEDEKDREIESLKVELDNLRHFCDSILDMAKRNNGVLYFRQDSGTWKIETGKDTDVPANGNDNNVGSMEENNG